MAYGDYGTSGQDMLEQELMNYLYSNNQYGGGPGQLFSTKDQYKGLGYQEDANADIFKMMGIYPEDLLNLREAPEDPGAAPVYQGFESDLRGAYANNALAKVAFDAMDQSGFDPVAATNAALAQYNENPDAYAAFVPTQYDEGSFGSGRPVDPSQAVVNFLNPLVTQYATDAQRESRERGQFDNLLNEYARKQEDYFRYNNPTDGLYDYGSPDLEGFRQQLGVDQAKKSYASERDYGAFDRWSDQAKSRGGSGVRIEPGVSKFDNQAFTRASLARNATDQERARGVSKGPRVQDAYLNKELDRQSAKRYQELQQQRVPSGREVDNRRRAALAQVLLGMG